MLVARCANHSDSVVGSSVSRSPVNQHSRCVTLAHTFDFRHAWSFLAKRKRESVCTVYICGIYSGSRYVIIPVSCVFGLQVRLQPLTSLHGMTTTLYLLLQVRSERAQLGAVSLHRIVSVASTARVSYRSAPRTGDHSIISVSQETAETDVRFGQQGTVDSK